MDDWMDGELAEAPKLNSSQVDRLMRMTEALRDDICLLMVAHIKKAFAEEDVFEAINIWNGLSDTEQEALWIAPKYGGIFTTEERKAIKEGAKYGV